MKKIGWLVILLLLLCVVFIAPGLVSVIIAPYHSWDEWLPYQYDAYGVSMSADEQLYSRVWYTRGYHDGYNGEFFKLPEFTSMQYAYGDVNESFKKLISSRWDAYKMGYRDGSLCYFPYYS